MTKELRKGDKVEWDSSGGHSTGKVVRKLTAPMTIKGHKVAASKDNPEYLVETEAASAPRTSQPRWRRGDDTSNVGNLLSA